MMKAKKFLKVFGVVFFVITWLLMSGITINLLIKARTEPAFGPLDIVRRISSPDGKKTAILVRSYGSFLDLNFALYISNNEMADVTDSNSKALFFTDPELSVRGDAAIWIKRALWFSRDYEKTTSRNFYEDIAWSDDGDLIAVTIEKQYAFAYDFRTGKRYENHGTIDEQFHLHNK